MKRFILALGLLAALSCWAQAKDIDPLPAGACLYEGKAFSEGARMCLSKGNLIDCERGKWVPHELALKDGSPVCSDT